MAWVGRFSYAGASTSKAAGTALTIPAAVPAESGGLVTLPVTFTADGEFISSIVFSIDFDESLLTFDPTDGNFDGIPDSVAVNVPVTHIASVVYDASDTNGEIDVTIFDPAVPLAALSDSNLLEITFGVANVTSSSTANVVFSADPPVSFGNTAGKDVTGSGVSGSVLISGTGTPTATATATASPSQTPTGTLSPTVMSTATATPAGQNTPVTTPTVDPSLNIGTMAFLPMIRRSPPTYNITGQVIDNSGIPLAGVTLTASNGSTTVTDANGVYQLSSMLAGVYTITPSLLNYQFIAQSIQLNGNRFGIDFVGTALATATPIAEPTPSAPNNVSATNTPTSGGGSGGGSGSGSDDSCGNLIQNNGFESGDSWQINNNEYPAGYASNPVYAGGRSMQVGISNVAENQYSYSSVEQTVSIPSNVSSARLSYQIYSISTGTSRVRDVPMPEFDLGSAASVDAQYTLIITQGGHIKTLVSQMSNANRWEYQEFDLSNYKGQSIRIYFGVFNNGSGGVTSSFVDEVAVTCS